MGSRILSGSQNPRRSRSSSSRNLSAVRRAAIESLEGRRMLNADIVVNTDQDESAANATTSLREAIALAVGMPGDDNITFDSTVFPAGNTRTITLGSDGALLVPASADKITITGPGADTVEV